MKIIVDAGKKKELIKLGNEAVLCVLGRRFPKLSYKKFLKQIGATKNDIFYASKNIKKRTLKKLSRITAFSKINTTEIFLNNIGNIVKHINAGEKMNICIYSDKKDERIFNLISSVNSFCSIIYLITKDENLYEEASEYALENHGIAINLKQFSQINEAHLSIVLNSPKTDFSHKSGGVINLSDTPLKAQKILADISPLNLPADFRTDIEKCVFLEKDCQKFDLIWKNSQKGVDKSEK